MATFKVSIEMDNAAFVDDTGRCEVARILADLATTIEEGGDMNRRLVDINGNTVGESDIR